MADGNRNVMKYELCLIKNYAGHAFLVELCMFNLPLDYVCFLKCVMPMLASILFLTLFQEHDDGPGTHTLHVDSVRLGTAGALSLGAWMACLAIFQIIGVPYFDMKSRFCLADTVNSYGFIFGCGLVILASYLVVFTTSAGIRMAHVGLMIINHLIRKIFFLC